MSHSEIEQEPQSDTIAEAEKIFEKLRDRSRHISVDRLMLDVSSLVKSLPDFCLFVRQKKFFRSIDDTPRERPFLLLYYMSFRVIGGKLTRFESRNECSEFFDRESGHRVIEDDDLVICTANEAMEEYEEELEAIADIMSMMFHSNIYDEILDNSARKFRRELSQNNPFYSIPEMLTYLVENYVEVEGLALLDVYRDRERNIVEVNASSYKGREIDFVTDDLHGAIDYAARTQKPSDGFFQRQHSNLVNYVVVPVVENIIRPSAPERAHRFILLYRGDREVDQFLVRFAQVGSQYSEEADVARSQINLLHELHIQHRDHVSRIRSGELQGHDERDAQLRRALTSVIRRVYDCTSAHSATVRIFDPLSKNLEILVGHSISTGEYEEGFPGTIAVNDRLSVNARCFRDCGPNDHVYIPLLSKPSDAHQRGRFEAETVLNPRRSRSEVCFPIWGDSVPLGTVNFESPIPRAFGRDLDFLESLSRSIADFVHSSWSTVPPEAVTQLARINELAHGISIDRSDLDPAIVERLPVTVKRTMDEFAHFVRELRTPTIMSREPREKLNQVVSRSLNRALNPIERDSFEVGQSLLISEDVLVGYEASIIQSVLDAVFSNSRKHSSLVKDHFRFEIIERSSSINIFRVEYEARAKLVDCSTLRSFGLVPVVQGGQTRFGAFLLGFRIRAAGGRLAVERPVAERTGYAPLRFVIEIPLVMT